MQKRSASAQKGRKAQRLLSLLLASLRRLHRGIREKEG
jgi:hypothetical protein